MKNLDLLKQKYRTLSKPAKALVWVAGLLVVVIVVGGCG